MPSSTARVSGRLIEKVEPWPGREAIVMRPPSAWIERLTTSMPTPRPEMLEIACAVEKPGMNSRLSISPSVSWASAAISSFLIAISRTRWRLMPAPSSDDLDDDAARAVRRRQLDLALRRLAGRLAHFRPFDAVIDGVADHVGERIGEALDHRAVDLGRFAFGAQPHRPCRSRRSARARCATCAGTAA